MSASHNDGLIFSMSQGISHEEMWHVAVQRPDLSNHYGMIKFEPEYNIKQIGFYVQMLCSCLEDGDWKKLVSMLDARTEGISRLCDMLYIKPMTLKYEQGQIRIHNGKYTTKRYYTFMIGDGHAKMSILDSTDKNLNDITFPWLYEEGDFIAAAQVLIAMLSIFDPWVGEYNG